MRSAARALLTVSALFATLVPACAPADTTGQGEDEILGAGKVESSVVWLFESDAKDAKPACAGALIGDFQLAIVPASCAKEGMTVGRADDNSGNGDRTKIEKVVKPSVEKAEIAIIKLQKRIGGRLVKITNAPLRGEYSIQGVTELKDRGFFNRLAPEKGEASSVEGAMISETSSHGSILPVKGSKLCAADLGAPVCSSTATKIFDKELIGGCGLAGLVIGPESPLSTEEGASTCSAAPWRVAELSPYIPFLKKIVPGAFQPDTYGIGPLRKAFAIDGLWGYKSAGKVTKCAITTTKVSPANYDTKTKLAAKVSFAEMQSEARGYGRFGFALKSAPDQMRWMVAKPSGGDKGSDVTFESELTLDAAGEYVIGFRASGNSAESWTLCSTEGVVSSFTGDKALSLTVSGPPPVDDGTGTPPTPGSTPEPPAPPSEDGSPLTPTPGEGTDENKTPTDPPAEPPTESEVTTTTDGEDTSETTDGEDTSESEDGEEGTTSTTKSGTTAATAAKKKKAAADSGCSMGSHSTSGGMLPTLGLALGVAAVLRRRRR